MTQHTPGPWAAPYKSNNYSMRHPVILSDTGNVATATWTGSEQLTDANARLIAAAPDLLEALKECRNAIQGGQPFEPYDSRGAGYQQCFGAAFLDYLNAAIAKATGGQP